MTGSSALLHSLFLILLFVIPPGVFPAFEVAFKFFGEFLGMVEVVLCVFFAQYLIKLDDGREREDAANDPAQHTLIGVDLVGDPAAAENEYTVAEQRTDANAEYVQIVVAGLGQQHFFGKE